MKRAIAVLAAGHVDDGVPLVLESQAHRGPDPLVVLDDQDAAHGPIMARPHLLAVGGSRAVGQVSIQIWVGQIAPPMKGKALAPAGVVGLAKFSTLAWAPMAHTVRSAQT